MMVSFQPLPISLRSLQDPLVSDPGALFDIIYERLIAGANVESTIDTLSDTLWWLHNDTTPERWLSLVEAAHLHPLMGLLHENPLLRRAFVKPRGYAGDSMLLDIVYDSHPGVADAATSPIGLELMERDLNTPMMMALRERRSFLGSLIDHVAETAAEPDILAAGCGHLREAALSTVIRQNHIGRLVAMDQDAEALAEVARGYGDKRLEIVNRGMTAAMDRTFEPSSFDLIYTNGAYEYLLDRFAQGLTRAFFDLLRPGGRLVIGNLVPGLYDRPYFECFGDWFMTYRDAAGITDLHRTIADSEIAMKRVYTRRSPDILYLEIRKR